MLAAPAAAASPPDLKLPLQPNQKLPPLPTCCCFCSLLLLLLLLLQYLVCEGPHQQCLFLCVLLLPQLACQHHHWDRETLLPSPGCCTLEGRHW